MAKNQTVETTASVASFIKKNDAKKQGDILELIEIFKSVTKDEAVMWGPAIIGFGKYHYKLESGREGDMALGCFSPRKSSLVIYLANFDKRETMLNKLGKHKLKGGCLHISKMEDVDVVVLKKIIEESVKVRKKQHV